MKKLLIPLLILGGCSGGGGQEESDAAAPAGTEAASAPPIQATGLTGLYEGDAAARTNQLCIVEREGEAPRFGLVVWGANLHSCSGSGTVEREGDRLRLKMAGDETCTIDARIGGNAIVLPDAVPDGCAYYCGAQARLTGARFLQVGVGRQNAARARDLVGDPLC